MHSSLTQKSLSVAVVQSTFSSNPTEWVHYFHKDCSWICREKSGTRNSLFKKILKQEFHSLNLYECNRGTVQKGQKISKRDIVLEWQLEYIKNSAGSTNTRSNLCTFSHHKNYGEQNR